MVMWIVLATKVAVLMVTFNFMFSLNVMVVVL